MVEGMAARGGLFSLAGASGLGGLGDLRPLPSRHCTFSSLHWTLSLIR
jgi:hypothetical protein